MVADVLDSKSGGMHVCADCGRSYKAVETLNRHRKNHSDETQYICQVCDASFKRKDLLDRHSQIHVTTNAQSRRRRGLRACVRCSRLKARCDNIEPCARCVQGGHACIYRTERQRFRKDSSNSSLLSLTDSSTDDTGAFPSIDTYADPLMAQAYSCSPPTDWTLSSLEWLQCWPSASTPQSLQAFNVSGTHSLDTGPPIASPEWFMHGSPVSEGRNSANISTSWPYFDMQPHPYSDSFHDTFGISKAQSAENGSRPMLERMQLLSDATVLPRLDVHMVDDPSLRSSSMVESCLSMEQPTDNEEVMDEPVTGSPTREAIVVELAWFAADFRPFCSHLSDRNQSWHTASEKMQLAFGISKTSGTPHLLSHFINLFFNEFDVHWPIICRHAAALEMVPPHLSITMAAIGAAYAGREAGEFHVQMTVQLRNQLLAATCTEHLDDTASFALCQSLALLQASMLFFGNRAAFRNAHEVSCVLVTTAERIKLFDELADTTVTHYLESSPVTTVAGNATKDWIGAESRRRLAVGILRLEGFLSILVGTRPQITCEDVNVQIPAPASVWLSADSGTHMFPQMRYNNAEQPVFSSVVHTALDESEVALPSLRADELEHVLYGLQHRVWRLSQEPGSGRRRCLDLSDDELRASAGNGDHCKLAHALTRWKHAMKLAVKPTEDPAQRSTILNSQLLYSVTIMKLRSDLPAFHRLALSATRDEPPLQETVLTAVSWAKSRGAEVTVQHALSIRAMVSEELQRPDASRAVFTIITQIALLNAALCVWVYIGGREAVEVDAQVDLARSDGGLVGSRLRRTDNAVLMRAFTDLLLAIQPLHRDASAKLGSYWTTPAALAERPLLRSKDLGS